MKSFTSKNQKIGEIGEEVAVKFLKKQKFQVIDRNYTKKWGEIDIVAKNKDSFRFIEVKTISDPGFLRVTRENKDDYRPEDQMHPWKLKRITRAVETYVAEKSVDEDWQIDLVAVYLDLDQSQAKVNFLENII